MQRYGRRALTALVAMLAVPAMLLGEVLLAGAAGAASVPGATHSVVATPMNGAASVSWKAPTTSGGSPVVRYVVTPYLGSVKQAALVFNSTATTQTVPNLKNASAYQFTVAATNAVGTGAASTKSVLVTVGSPGQPRRPMATWATNITGQLRVYFEAAAKNGCTGDHLQGCLHVVERRREQLRDRPPGLERHRVHDRGEQAHVAQVVFVPGQRDQQPRNGTGVAARTEPPTRVARQGALTGRTAPRP